jgi:phospholipid-transporting ATPase
MTQHVKLKDEHEEVTMRQPFLITPSTTTKNYANTSKRKRHFWHTEISWTEMPDRMIYSNYPDYELVDNSICTSKYTFLSFLPKNLLEQFSKLPNLYFLLIGFLQMVREISTSGGLPVIFVPLTIVLTVTAIKDMFEDLKRHRDDETENNNVVLKYEGGEFEPTRWHELRVGDIVKVQNNEFIPADLILLQTSDPKGSCFVETKNLDGETNLKKKSIAKDLTNYYSTLESYSSQVAQLNYERPNPYLYKFRGSMKLSNNHEFSLDASNFLLRSCSLRSEYAVGVVVYSGHDTKIMLNSVRARAKSSRLERIMNKQIFYVFIIQMILCLLVSCGAAVLFQYFKNIVPYLHLNSHFLKDSNFFMVWLIKFGNWVLIFTNFVPISLIVTLETVKFLQGKIMATDPKMVALATQMAVSVQSSRLNEELGQINYVFSDKTGTLTCNVMEFKNICVMDSSFGEDYGHRGVLPKVSNVNFKDKNFFTALNNSSNNNHKIAHECLLMLSLCHTIFPEEKGDKIFYNASSPDELALVNFAKMCGYEFTQVDSKNTYTIKRDGGNMLNYQILHVLEFNSTRKRMSVIFEDSNGNIVLYCKGADSIIIDRMAINKNMHVEKVKDHLTRYAESGLRTLLLSKRVINKKEYLSWNEKYLKACLTMKDRETEMERIQEEIEVELEIIGATAIEDKLQDDVATTISSLKDSGIKVWVLTGDKQETAINIGYSCKLLHHGMQNIVIDGKSTHEIITRINHIDDDLRNNPKYDDFALVISGDALLEAMKPHISEILFNICEKSKVVIACRVSPKQKKEIVELVKQYAPDKVTLAIGDGANDVNMITAAHVGIGIRGLEGYQAARASDYAIGEFKLLRRLLFYYGRESYRKNSGLVCYNFYKNLLLVLPQFWFGFVNMFSGQILYDPILFQLYNIMFTALPIVVYALVDKEFPGSYLEKNPRLYKGGLSDSYFNSKIFWFNFMLAAFQAILIPIFSFFSMEGQFVDCSGHMSGFWNSGMMCYGALIIVVNFKILLISQNANLLNYLAVFGSIAAFIVCFLIFNHLKFDLAYEDFHKNYDHFALYFGTILILCSTTLIEWAYARYFCIIKISEEVSIYEEKHPDSKRKESKNKGKEVFPSMIELGSPGSPMSPY